MLTPTPLKPGENYASVAEIRDCVDLPDFPVTPVFQRADGGVEPLWTRPDGSALTILVRGLDFTERREVNQDAGDSDDQFTLETCLRGIKEPKFSREQLKDVLAHKHPAALDEIADTIWALSNLPAGMVAAEVRRLAGLPRKSQRAKSKRPVA
jgi:hypothetical protein